MKKLLKPKTITVLAVLLGFAGQLLRIMLYRVALDERNLLRGVHPLLWLMWIFTALSLAFLLFAAWKMKGSGVYQETFRPSAKAMAGYLVMALGLLLTVLQSRLPAAGLLGTVWKILGFVAPVCLVAAGLERLRGKCPFFALHMVPCLFFLVHIVTQYQLWSSNPQLQDYFYALFGSIALMLFAYQLTAYDVGLGQRRMLLGTGLSALFLLTVQATGSVRYSFLYMTGIVWVLLELGSVRGRGRKKPVVQEEQP